MVYYLVYFAIACLIWGFLLHVAKEIENSWFASFIMSLIWPVFLLTLISYKFAKTYFIVEKE
jgi:hypothetical protein